ncbi:MAG: coproporphyrinogen dehydrogenase HemZ [Butyrivibrio sp.]|nr:coproporphyrinogen dehydrogenase HemZ [Butyrivibrio sp.]
MIVVNLNKDKYKYDIHSLIKAFYPEQDIKMVVEGEPKDHSDKGQIEIDIINNEEKGLLKMVIHHPEGADTFLDINCLVENSKEDEEEGDIEADVNTNGVSGNLQTAKNAMKQLIYIMLKKETGTELPWGTLTGIRPTKIAMKILENGGSAEDIRSYMKNTYFTGEEKIDVSIKIAQREKSILDSVDYKNGYSLYIGIPFCPTTCMYCSFTSFPIGLWKDKVDRYIECLKKEIDYVSKAFKDQKLCSLYIGGGTPTTLEPDQMERLLGYVEDKLDLSYMKELTVESGRPDSITRDKLIAMKKHGVSRISVNPQTMRDETLKFIGRRHTVAQFIDAYKMARQEGFDNINMDIILGLPKEGPDDVKYTMEEIEKLMPDDLTVHSLALKRGSRLYEHMKQNGVVETTNTDEMMKTCADGAARMGLSPYYLYRQKNMTGNFENTGYAREGKAGLYNMLIMEDLHSIVALGTGTVTKRIYRDENKVPTGRIERCDNVKDVKLYMEHIDEMIERKKRLFE